ncbi:uncharacterized protein LOC143367053 [Andrena cerasifolii]|uniref:uncharacterized protein LOC143367053 n=1 Tax=Andrena cerasifolii TaxID=2819439 RepID=UPI004037650C
MQVKFFTHALAWRAARKHHSPARAPESTTLLPARKPRIQKSLHKRQKSMSRSWSVIKFLEDGFVEAVPSSWLEGEFSFWPPIAAKMVTAVIKKCEPPPPSWPKHQVKLLTRVTFDTYLKAREKARLAEDTSDLQSDEPPAKRRRIPKTFWSSKDSGNEIEDLDKSTQNIQVGSFNEKYLEERVDDAEEHLDVDIEQRLEEIRGMDTSSFQSTPIENCSSAQLQRLHREQ